MNDNETNNDMPIYRYYNLESFMYLIGSRRLRFSRITEWPDKFEGINYTNSEKIINNNPEINLDNIWGSCWTQEVDIRECHSREDDHLNATAEIQNEGSAALWEQYCGNSGVRVKTTIGKILDRLNTFKSDKPHVILIHDKVQYCPGLQIQLNTKDCLFLKRTPFRHECEYRFLLIDKERSQNNIEVDIGDPLVFFDEFLISPTTKRNNWITHTIYQTFAPIFSDMSSNNKNGNNFCRKSQLYEKTSNELGWHRYDRK